MCGGDELQPGKGLSTVPGMWEGRRMGLFTPKREDVERMIRNHILRADELARQGKMIKADIELRKAERLERALPKSR